MKNTPLWHPVLLLVSLTTLASAEIVINEIHYAPFPDNEEVQFIELHNSGAETIDLAGWHFSDGFEYTFPADSSLDADAYLILAQNEAQYNKIFGSIFVGGIKASGEFASGQLSGGGETITLRNASNEVIDRVSYSDGFPWPVTAGGDGPSMELIHPGLDNDLGGSWRSGTEPTPGEQNSVYAEKAAPHIRQVSHSPKAPLPGEEVVVTAKVTDPQSVKAVTLRYQLVQPGKYIQIDDETFLTEWTELPMADNGEDLDIYTVTLPGDLQKHRHLMRYQITVEDGEGTAIAVPYSDDAQPNFAYYCYGDMPAWTGTAEPGESEEVTYGPELLKSVAVYQLITSKANHVEAQHITGTTRSSGYTGSDYLWKGTLVYDGDVYDHISFRARGGVWRYAMGKNMWKFLLNRSHEFQARDPLGEKYPTKWRRVNFSSMIQQGNFSHRGEQGLFESVGFDLFNKAGIEAPYTNYVHFRIVENSGESNLFNNQYTTDFQGLYLAIEQLDSRFMRAHDIPEGNLYKMENGTGEKGLSGVLKNTAPFPAVSDYTDLETFKKNGYEKNPDEAWYRENFDLPRYYAYRAVVESIHHYDIGNGKNYYYYHNPESNKWATLPWDLDLTWDNRMYGPGTEPFQRRVSETAPFEQDYHNKLREFIGLLYNEEQTGLIIDEKASAVFTPGEPSLVDADRAMWDYNPILTSRYVNSSKAGHGLYYRIADTDDFPGMMNRMKDYVVSRSEWMEDQVLDNTESMIPNPPTVTAIGSADFTVDDLRFESTAFKGGSIFSPQKFGAVKWRLAEITDVTAPDFSPEPPNKYEIDAVWESEVLTEFAAEITIPAEEVRPGRVYRVRARMQNERGYWSYWSGPVQFVAGLPNIQPLLDNLVISEVLYSPTDATSEELVAGYQTADFEFVELLNLGSTALDLNNVRFTKGIDYDFSQASLQTIEPGQRILLAANIAAFVSRYGQSLPVIGEYGGEEGSKLNNNGERLKLSFGAGVAIRDFKYENGDGWPEVEKGTSLVLIDTAALTDPALASSWGTSGVSGGTPGVADDGVVIVDPEPSGGYADWQSNQFTAEQTGDAAISGLLADPDNDGWVNLQEYAFSGNPLGAETHGPEVVTDDGAPQLAITRPSRASDLTYTIEQSADLTSWKAYEPAAQSTVLDDQGQERVQFQINLQDGPYWRIVTTKD